MNLRAWILCCLAVATTLSCSGDTTVVHTDGDACILPQGADTGAMTDVVYVAGEPLDAMLYFNTCLSSSCDRVEGEPTCVATLEGNVISVSGSATVTSTGGICTDDCGFVSARCALTPLSEGVYEVRVNGVSAELTIPSTRQSPFCVGSGAPGTP